MRRVTELWTIREVADYLRTTPGTAYQLAREGALPGVKIGGQWRFDRRRVQRWVAQLHQRRPRIPHRPPELRRGPRTHPADEHPFRFMGGEEP